MTCDDVIPYWRNLPQKFAVVCEESAADGAASHPNVTCYRIGWIVVRDVRQEEPQAAGTEARRNEWN